MGPPMNLSLLTTACVAALAAPPAEDSLQVTGDKAALRAVRAGIATHAERFPAGRATFRSVYRIGCKQIGGYNPTKRARGTIWWDAGAAGGADRVRVEAEVEESNEFPDWGQARSATSVYTFTPRRSAKYTAKYKNAAFSTPPLPLPRHLHVWPNGGWFIKGGPGREQLERWDRRLSFPEPWTVRQSAAVSRDGDLVTVVERYENGAERTVRCSFAAGGNVIDYRLRAYDRDRYEGRSSGYDKSYSDGSYEWAEHEPGVFRLEHLVYRGGAGQEPRLEDYQLEVWIDEFERDGGPLAGREVSDRDAAGHGVHGPAAVGAETRRDRRGRPEAARSASPRGVGRAGGGGGRRPLRRGGRPVTARVTLVTLLCGGAAVCAGPAVAAEPPADDPLCGLHCLYMGLRLLGEEATPDGLRADLGEPAAGGYVFGELARVAEDRGLVVRPVEADLAWLRDRTGPLACVAQVRGSHFVLITGVAADGTVTYLDPPRREQLPAVTFGTLYDGNALLIARSEAALADRPVSWGGRVLWAAAVAAAVAACVGAVLYVRRRGDGTMP